MNHVKLLDHTADLKLAITADSCASLFKYALIGMFQSSGPRSPVCVKNKEGYLVCPSLPISRSYTVTASDRASLLVDFLSYALWLSDVHNEAYLDVTIHELQETTVAVTVHGIAIQGFDVVEIKAVTYHDLSIQEQDGYWYAEIVFDI